MNSKLLLILLVVLPFCAFAKFRITYQKPVNQNYQLIFKYLKNNPDILNQLVKEVNDEFIIDQNVRIVVRECGLANSRYVVDESRIYLCYETIWAKVSILTGMDDKHGANASIEHGARFSLLHEIGHVLIYQLGLVDSQDTENHEKLADQFAMVCLLNSDRFKSFETAWLNSLYFEHRRNESKTFENEYEKERGRVLFKILYGFSPKPSIELKKKAMVYDLEKSGCVKFYNDQSVYWQNHLLKISKGDGSTLW